MFFEYVFHVVIFILLLFYLYVSGSGSITSVEEERANLPAFVYMLLCDFSWRGFFFLWVLWMGFVVLLWHSLSLPYNYFSKVWTD